MRTGSVVLSLTIAFSLASTVAHAQWQLDGVPLCTATGYQDSPVMTPDGAGGTITAWVDGRPGLSTDVYVQKVNVAGVPQWTPNGVAVCTAAGDQYGIVITTDGAGGAIIAWYDRRTGTEDIYVQRVNAAGVPQWAANGVALCTAANAQLFDAIVSDGAGGAIVTWQDARTPANVDIYVRRVNAAGVPQWTADGVPLCTALGSQDNPMIISDGAGGAIVAWNDSRTASVDIYARRVNAAGTALWTSDGVAVCTAGGDQFRSRIIPDGSGGAILTWQDERNAVDDIYAQRVNATGVPQWTIDGVEVCTATGTQQSPLIATDGSGGAIIAWTDYRVNGVNPDVYAQRLSGSGDPLWLWQGIAIIAAANDQYAEAIASDGAGGALMTWTDFGSISSDIYAQRVNGAGLFQWVSNGAALCTSNGQQYAPTIAVDGAGGTVVSWYDYRSGISDIYAQRADMRYGYWGHPEPILASVSDVRKDQGGQVALNWTASARDLPSPRTIGHYSIWRAVTALPLDASTGTTVALQDMRTVRLDTRVAYAAASPATDYYWELVGTQAAQGLAGYSFSASTRADSLLGNAATEYFMVMAHDNSDDYVAFASNVGSGHSVDNLAPAAPIQLSGSRAPIGDVVLAWKSGGEIPDLDHYNVYRSGVTGVTPTAPFLVGASDSPSFDDLTAPTGPVHYLVTAIDIHGNESLPSNIVALFDATGTGGNSPPIKALTVLQNRPNPFAGSTDLEIGLPATSDVHVEVYDIAGHRVSTMEVKGAPAGWRSVPFAGLDAKGKPLASGVYFYKVTAHGTTVTNKMVIAR